MTLEIIFPFLMGIIMLVIAFKLYISSLLFLKKAVHTKAIIQNIELEKDKYDGIGLYSVVLKYLDKDNNEFINRDFIDIRNIKIGDEIDLYYEKGNPNNFKIELENYTYLFVLFWFATIFFIIGGIILYIVKVIP